VFDDAFKQYRDPCDVHPLRRPGAADPFRRQTDSALSGSG